MTMTSLSGSPRSSLVFNSSRLMVFICHLLLPSCRPSVPDGEDVSIVLSSIEARVRTAVASPVHVDTAHTVGQTAALAAQSGHSTHLPDNFPTVVERGDILAHSCDTGRVALLYVAWVAA